MARTPEGRIEDYLRDRCREHGYLCLKFTSPARSGVPDRLVVTPHATVFVELKRPGRAQPRRLQLAQHERLRRAGAIVHVLSTRDAVDAFVQTLGTTRDSAA